MHQNSLAALAAVNRARRLRALGWESEEQAREAFLADDSAADVRD
jgi:hypothetical protein